MREDEVFIQKRPKAMPLASFKRSCIIKYGAGLKFKELK